MGELVGLVDEAGRRQPHEERHVEIDKAQKRNKREDEDREDLAREASCLFAPARFENTRIRRQVGRVERALAENLAELVGQLDRRDIGVVERAAAE